MAQPVAQSADICPGLRRKQDCRSLAKAKYRFANTFQTPLDRIVSQVVFLQPVLIQTFGIPVDPSNIVDDILQAVELSIPLRRHEFGPVRR